MKLLLDTHILLWAALKPELLPQRLRDRLLDPQHSLLLSAATAWELSIKHHLGKLPEAAPLLAFTEAARATRCPGAEHHRGTCGGGGCPGVGSP